jgi:predicted secreted protein with PEFG-CTERM motif
MIMKNLLLSIIIMSLSSFVTYSITYNAINHIAFAQQGNDPTLPPTTGDNMTSGDNSTDVGNAPIPDDNSTGMNSIGGPPDLGLPANNMSGDVQQEQNMTTPNMATQNTTTQSIPSQATPEFGPIAILVLIMAIISIVVISSRSRLGFRN